ncbi:MAG TPA: TolC family protein [Bryobacteraceae bacterium]|nr:TolC family protein [Bryobacteraceae bacterium]
MRRIALFSMSTVLAFAQGTLPLSMKRAVEVALAPEGSPRVELAEESIRQAQTHVSQARAAFLPDIEGSASDQNQTLNLQSYGLTIESPIPGFSFPSFVGPFSGFDARVSAQQSVFDFSSIRRFQSSKVGVEAAKADAANTRDQVSDTVARAYLLCLRADAKLETERANVELSDALLKLAQRQKVAGTGLTIEVTRAQVQLANDRQQLIVAENDRRRAVLGLLRAMGLNLDAHIEFTDKLVYKPVDVGTVEAALEKAHSSRQELKAQAKREEVARLNYGSVKAESLPSVSAFGNYGSTGTEIHGSLPTRSIGISMRVPIFDGGRRGARRAETLSQLRQEQVHTRDIQQQVDLDVRLALDSIRSAASQVETAREGLALAENELAQARRRYEGGVANSIEVTDAQTRLDRARDNQIAALFSYNLARLELATATGSIAEYVNQ